MGSREQAPFVQRLPTIKGTDKISHLKIFFCTNRTATGRPDLMSLLWPISYQVTLQES